jgi:hypothetical protein
MKITLFRDYPVDGGNTFLQNNLPDYKASIPEGSNLQPVFSREKSEYAY